MTDVHGIKLDYFKYPWYEQAFDFVVKYLGLKIVIRQINKVRKILRWVPILWNDMEFSYDGLFNIITFRTERISKTVTENDFIDDEEQDKIRKSIRIFNKLLIRSQDEDWHSDLQKNILARKWGKAIWWSPDKIMHDKDEFALRGKDGKVRAYPWMRIVAPKEVLENDTYKEYSEEYRQTWQLKHEKTQKDLELALEVFKKYYRIWWD